MKEASRHDIRKSWKHRTPTRGIIRKYSQSPARPSEPMSSTKIVSFPEKSTKSAIAHIAAALTNRRKNRLIDKWMRGACTAHKSLEICERCRLRQQNSPASAGKFCCFLARRVLKQFVFIHLF